MLPPHALISARHAGLRPCDVLPYAARWLGRRIVRVCNVVITLLGIHNHILDFVNLVGRIVLVPSDLHRQQLGVDTAPENALVLLALAHAARSSLSLDSCLFHPAGIAEAPLL